MNMMRQDECMKERLCAKCKTTKPISDFYTMKKTAKRKQYYQAYCRQCHRDEVKEWRRNNVDYCRSRNFHRRYGLTMDKYKAMSASQNDLCAICGNGETRKFRGMTRVLSVDHHHGTKAIRGLLCNNCNAMIGYAKDDIQILESAITYIKSHS